MKPWSLILVLKAPQEIRRPGSIRKRNEGFPGRTSLAGDILLFLEAALLGPAQRMRQRFARSGAATTGQDG